MNLLEFNCKTNSIGCLKGLVLFKMVSVMVAIG